MDSAGGSADPLVVRVRVGRWWLGLITVGVLLICSVTAAVLGGWPTGIIFLISAVSQVFRTFGHCRVLRDLGPLALVDADGLTVLGTTAPWSEIETVAVIGPGFTFLGSRRSRWAVTTKAAVRFGRRTGRRPDRVVLPLSGLDHPPHDVLAAVERFGPPGLVRR